MKGTQGTRAQSGSLAGTSRRCCRCHARGDHGGGRFQDGLRGKGAFKQEQGPSQQQEIADLFGGRQLDLGRGIELGTDGAGGNEPDPLNWDPEGLYKKKGNTTLQDGHIERRMAWKENQSEEEKEKALARKQAEAEKEAEERRAAVELPTEPAALVPFFLDCHPADMEYWIAKAAPKLDKTFFGAIDSELGEERLLDSPDDDRIAELEGLRGYVQQTLAAQAAVARGVVNATERLKKLLSSSNLKETILQMAADNEIDPALMQLLAKNVEGATAAGQADAAQFMSKVRDACAKYYIAPDKGAKQDAQVRSVLQQAATQGDGEAGTTTPGGLILP